MAAPITIRMTLTGCLEGMTKKLNQVQFVKGECLYTGSQTEIEGITRYFTTSYQVKVETVTVKSLQAEAEAAKEAEAEAKPEQTRENTDSEDDLGTTEEVAELEEKATDPVAPNSRQAAIIAAINCIEKDKWVDLESNCPRPKVSDVKEQAKDPTIKVSEITEVIQEWLS